MVNILMNFTYIMDRHKKINYIMDSQILIKQPSEFKSAKFKMFQLIISKSLALLLHNWKQDLNISTSKNAVLKLR